MEQQENQYNIENNTEEMTGTRCKKAKKQIFLSGLFWGFIAGGMFSCICILAIRGIILSQNNNVIQIQKAEKEDDSKPQKEALDTAITAEMIQKLRTLEDAIDVYYYQEGIDYEAMQDGILSGLVDSLNDPYSEYYTKEEIAQVNLDNEGVYYGIGAYVSMDTMLSMPKISGVIPGTPAEEAGLRENDVITEVDGISMYQLTTQDAVRYIRGEEGTTVELTLYREGEPDYLHFTVERRKVESPTVNYEMMGEVGYLQITSFDEVTVHQFQDAYTALEQEGMKGLIIDVRSNPGGMLTTVLDICREILPKGLIVYTEDKYGERNEYTCDGKNEIDIPLVVLINGNSASASEILAGAVQDYGIGTIVGKTTYGKGVVQNIFGLSDGTAVKLTISNYFTPKGNNIHGIGVQPDVEVELDVDKYYDEDVDTQIEKALEILNKEIK